MAFEVVRRHNLEHTKAGQGNSRREEIMKHKNPANGDYLGIILLIISKE